MKFFLYLIWSISEISFGLARRMYNAASWIRDVSELVANKTFAIYAVELNKTHKKGYMRNSVRK